MLNRMYVFLSAARGTSETMDERNHHSLVSAVTGTHELEHDEVTGCYNGVVEKSIVVQVPDFFAIGALIKEAKKYEQESVLIVDSRRKAFLYYPASNVMDYVGVMYTSETLPENVENYSIINGIYHYTF